MASWNPAADGRTFVILGSGAAGSAAAEALREDGYEGRLVMVTRDAHLPYDRTALSKGYLKGMDPAGALLPLRSQTFYETHDIDVVLGRSITQVDTFGKQVTFDKEPPLAYDALLIATGSRPRQLGIPGEQLSNVFTLRSLDDANRIIAAAKPAAHAVVVGSSFIGMEAAANLAERGLGVTVVAPVIPFAKIFGAEIGRFFQRIHEERGVTFRLGTTVSRFEGDGEVRCAVLQNGMRVGCDLAVTGVGVDPATGMLGGVALNPDGSLSVDEHFRVREGLYAAGDVARFADWRTGKWLRIEHWRTAQQQGRIAAHNMAGKSSVFRGIPFFWTAQFGLFAQYVGHAAEWDEVIVQGDLSSKEFIAFYTAGDRVLAALGCTRSAELGALGELMRTNRMPSAGKLRKEEIDWIARLRDETDHCCRNGRGA
jgi:NADPH-dependent 2,4-dienoyl-CoA reductase/sulfur reductase-like enzyme